MHNKISPSQYAELLYEICLDGNKIAKKIKAFSVILARNNDFKKFNEIIKEFESYEKKQGGVSDVELISASPLAKEVKNQIVGAMAGKCEIKETVNPDLLGGVIVISGDMMIDGSFRKKLRELSRSLS